ncbi:MAG: hypothetical protein K2Q12_07555, partial [Rickettsiales bacterium]|nr:hypothetical protein [Rickettsiales bacterium]
MIAGMTQRLSFLFIDFNSYFASVEQQLQPHLRGRPVLVMPLASEHTCAIAASYSAKAFGIKTGTPVWEARQRCPGIVCVEARPALYVEYHHRLCAEIERHIPIYKQESIDEMSCRLDRSQQQAESACALAQRIKQGIAAHVGEALTCSIGISSNRFLAKVATDLHKPDGLTLLPPAEVPSRLGHLPINELPGIGSRMDLRIRARGIGTIGELYRLSMREMRHLWGSVEGEKMWQRLQGFELVEPPVVKRVVGHSHVLDPEWRPLERAETVARRLLLKAASRLRRYGMYASAMELSARIEHGPRLTVSIRFVPACDNATLMQALGVGWGRLVPKCAYPSRVKKLSVQLHGLSDHRPSSLFAAQDRAAQWRQQQEVVSRMMDRLNTHYGRDTITLGAL